MATTYPGTIDSFTNPVGTNTLDSPDHALQHSDANDGIEAIETVLGTTAGTSVLMDFTAGQFPVRYASGTAYPGTLTFEAPILNNPILGTPVINGGTISGTVVTLAGTQTLTNKTLTSPKLNEDVALTSTSTELNALDGQTGAWNTATLNWTNLTVGAGGTVIARYVQIGKICIANISFIFGSGSAISGAVSFTGLPSSKYLTTAIGNIEDVGTRNITAVANISGANCYIRAMGAGSTYVIATELSSSVPMTWTTNDNFKFTLVYEVT